MNKEVAISKATDIGLETIDVLRRIRGAAKDKRRGFSDLFRHPWAPVQQNLRDAEILTTASASLMVDLCVDMNFDNFQQWNELFLEYKNNYQSHDPLWLSSPDRKADINVNCLSMSNGLDFLGDMLLRGNGLQHLGLGFLRNDRLGIFAPLSTDFLYVVLYRTYLQKRKIVSYEAKPVILGDRKHILKTGVELLGLPLDDKGRLVFQDLTDVRGMVDMGSLYGTRWSLNNVLRTYYPKNYQG